MDRAPIKVLYLMDTYAHLAGCKMCRWRAAGTRKETDR